MLTRRERILQALIDTLSVVPATLARNRRSPVDASEAPHLNVIEGSQDASYDDVGDVAYTLEVDVEGVVTAETDAGLGSAMNALYGQVVSAIMADYSLGGLCIDIKEGSSTVRFAPTAESAEPFAEFALGLDIRFRTPDTDPTG